MTFDEQFQRDAEMLFYRRWPMVITHNNGESWMPLEEPQILRQVWSDRSHAVMLASPNGVEFVNPHDRRRRPGKIRVRFDL